MIRTIIHIDKETCTGCGLCITACHEGALALIDGKAQLVRDDYCDGLGNCLPACPTGAISFVEREAAAFDEAAVATHAATAHAQAQPLPCDCPGASVKSLKGSHGEEQPSQIPAAAPSHLKQWPVQMSLVPAHASFLEKSHLLIAADCAAYSYGNFHQDFMRDKVTLIGCPKLDSEDYSEKLTAILLQNSVQSLTVARMEVPCCSGIEHAIRRALQSSKEHIPGKVAVISLHGEIQDTYPLN